MELEILAEVTELLGEDVAGPFVFRFSLYVPELALRNPFRMIAPLKAS